MNDISIRHDPIRRLFEVEANGHVAHLEYRLKTGVLTIVHTIVPPPLEGQGLGAALVEAAVAHAAHAGLQVASECSYASHRLASLGASQASFLEK